MRGQEDHERQQQAARLAAEGDLSAPCAHDQLAGRGPVLEGLGTKTTGQNNQGARGPPDLRPDCQRTTCAEVA